MLFLKIWGKLQVHCNLQNRKRGTIFVKSMNKYTQFHAIFAIFSLVFCNRLRQPKVGKCALFQNYCTAHQEFNVAVYRFEKSVVPNTSGDSDLKSFFWIRYLVIGGVVNLKLCFWQLKLLHNGRVNICLLWMDLR